MFNSRNNRKYDKNKIDRGLFSLGFGAVLGVACAIALAVEFLLIISLIVLVVWIICYIIKQTRNKKVANILRTIDTCTEEDFTDIVADILASAFSKNYVIKSKKYFGEYKIGYNFVQSEQVITLDEVLDIYYGADSKIVGIVTNSYLESKANIYCGSKGIIVIDRDTLADIIYYDLKHKRKRGSYEK